MRHRSLETLFMNLPRTTSVIAYAVEYNCAPRQTLGDRRIARMMASEQAPSFGPHAPPCCGCPADVHGRRVGCFGRVALPLTKADECWLVDRLPRTLATTAGYTLHSALGDFGWDGAYAARLRTADAERTAAGSHPEHFESPEPMVMESELCINSNQVFDMLFGEGHVQRSHPLLLCLFFGLLPHDTSPEALAILRQRPGALSDTMTLPDASHDLSGALRAVGVAATLGRQFFVQA